MNDLKSENSWIQEVASNCQQLLTEAHFTANWTIITAYHTLGSYLKDEATKHNIKVGELVAQVRKIINKSESTLYRAVQFSEKYPDLDKLPEGKDTNWHKICNKYLPETVREKKLTTCPKCGFQF